MRGVRTVDVTMGKTLLCPLLLSLLLPHATQAQRYDSRQRRMQSMDDPRSQSFWTEVGCWCGITSPPKPAWGDEMSAFDRWCLDSYLEDYMNQRFPVQQRGGIFETCYWGWFSSWCTAIVPWNWAVDSSRPPSGSNDFILTRWWKQIKAALGGCYRYEGLDEVQEIELRQEQRDDLRTLMYFIMILITSISAAMYHFYPGKPTVVREEDTETYLYQKLVLATMEALSKTRLRRVEDRKWDSFIKTLLQHCTSLARYQHQAKRYMAGRHTTRHLSAESRERFAHLSRRDQFEATTTRRQSSSRERSRERRRSSSTQNPPVASVTYEEEPPATNHSNSRRHEVQRRGSDCNSDLDYLVKYGVLKLGGSRSNRGHSRPHGEPKQVKRERDRSVQFKRTPRQSISDGSSRSSSRSPAPKASAKSPSRTRSSKGLDRQSKQSKSSKQSTSKPLSPSPSRAKSSNSKKGLHDSTSRNELRGSKSAKSVRRKSLGDTPTKKSNNRRKSLGERKKSMESMNRRHNSKSRKSLSNPPSCMKRRKSMGSTPSRIAFEPDAFDSDDSITPSVSAHGSEDESSEAMRQLHEFRRRVLPSMAGNNGLDRRPSFESCSRKPSKESNPSLGRKSSRHSSSHGRRSRSKSFGRH